MWDKGRGGGGPVRGRSQDPRKGVEPLRRVVEGDGPPPGPTPGGVVVQAGRAPAVPVVPTVTGDAPGPTVEVTSSIVDARVGPSLVLVVHSPEPILDGRPL